MGIMEVSNIQNVPSDILFGGSFRIFTTCTHTFQFDISSLNGSLLMLIASYQLTITSVEIVDIEHFMTCICMFTFVSGLWNLQTKLYCPQVKNPIIIYSS